MDINRAILEQFYFSVSAAFMDGLGTAESQYGKIAMTVPSSTKENVYPWLGTLPSMQKWAGDRIIRNLKAHKYSIESEKFEMTIAVKRDDIEDDQVTASTAPCSATWARQARLPSNQLVFGALKKVMNLRVGSGQYFSMPTTRSTENPSRTPSRQAPAPWPVVPHVRRAR